MNVACEGSVMNVIKIKDYLTCCLASIARNYQNRDMYIFELYERCIDTDKVEVGGSRVLTLNICCLTRIEILALQIGLCAVKLHL